jgi:hypothetical protein
VRLPLSTGLLVDATPDIDRALDACDYLRAATLAIDRVRAGEEVSATTIARILPGIRDSGLAAGLLAIGTTDRAEAWLAAVRDRRFPDEAGATFIETMVLYAAWRAGAPNAEIGRQVRRIARSESGAIAYEMLTHIAYGINEAQLVSAIKRLREHSPIGATGIIPAIIDKYLTTPAAELAEKLSATPPPPATGYTIRVAPRVGRNEPCPCGSGRKYKRCCADRDMAVAPSPVAGLSWDEYVTTAADRMTDDDVRGLPLHDLGRVELGKLRDAALVAAVERFLAERLFARAKRGADELARRGAPMIDRVRDQIIAGALDVGAIETADAQLAAMRDRSAAGLHALEIDVQLDRAGALAALLAAANGAVSAADDASAAELASTLLRAAPALGVLVARGCLRSNRGQANDNLLRGIEDARDVLDLASGDPAWDVRAALDDNADVADHGDDGGAAEASELRGSLRAASFRVDELTRQLAAQQADLDAARAAGTERATVARDEAAEAEKLRRLRDRIGELEGLVRERNAERGELRQQLAAVNVVARPGPAAAAKSDRSDDDDEDAVCESLAETERAVAMPVISKRAHDALGGVPQPVAAETMRTVGVLAAGDASAWRRVKQAKGMPRQVLTARIGIHYRMLFRQHDGELEVIDLIHRSALLATLKRMRANK